MPQGDGFSAKTLGKSLVHFQTDWSGNGPAGQFWQWKAHLVSHVVRDGLNFSVYAENLKELCHKFYQNSNSRNCHQIE